MNYFSFFKEHPQKLSFGFLHAFFAGLGQTFLLALFVPEFIQKFNLTNTSFGFFYSAATICNALLLSWVGSNIDHTSLKKYSLSTLLLFIVSTLGAAFSPNLWLLFPAIVGIRLAGQGLMTHISKTAMSKNFSNHRGKALGISSLGHPAGEAILAPVLAIILLKFSYQEAFVFIALILVLVYLPLNLFLLKAFKDDDISNKQNMQSKNSAIKKSLKANRVKRRTILLSKKFLILIPAGLLPPFILTGLFLIQQPLAISKGWEPLWIAKCFSAFAIARIISSIIIGPMIDKYGAKKLYSFYLIPILIGIITLLLFDSKWTALSYLAFSGISMGFGSNLKPAIATELFGTTQMGTARSLMATSVAIATGLSPITFGWIADKHLLMDSMVISIVVIIVTSIATWIMLNKDLSKL